MNVKKITIIGTGVIGGSWAAFFLSKGFAVAATDPAPGAEGRLRSFVKSVWPELQKLGLSPGASMDNLTFTPDLNEALKGADLVSENGPERLDFKQDVFQKVDAVLPGDKVIVSSSSGLTMSKVSAKCANHPERCVTAHPFNPPHLIPLVEVLGGEKTTDAAITDTIAFFEGLGKKCVRLKKEVPSFIANRIASALFKEVCWLIDQDVASVTDIDRAVSWGPGLRWGIYGQVMLYNLGGGDGGMKHFFEQFADSLNNTFKNLGEVELTPALQQKIIDGVTVEMGSQTLQQLEADRDKVLIELINARKAVPGVVSR